MRVNYRFFNPESTGGLCLEIDKSALGIGGDELYGNSVADVEALSAANHHAFNVRIESAHEGSVVGGAGDDGLEGLADAWVKNNRGDAFLHFALHFACGVFHQRAPLRDGVEVVF